MSSFSLLGVFLDRLGWSPDRLAREVNRVSGTRTISAKAPYGWVKGSYPRGQVAEVVASILARRLGEPITVDTVWPIRREQDATRSLDAGFRETDHGRCEFSEGGSAVAALDWLIGMEMTAPGRTTGAELDPETLTTLADRTAALRILDDLHGARFVLPLVEQEVRWTLDLARTSAYGQQDGIRLHGLIAELTQLAGWLSVDNGDHARAHRFFLTGLRAARLAGDCPLGAYILSCMAYQSIWMGKAKHSLRLAQTAVKGMDARTTPDVRGVLFTRLARAYALLGDERGTAEALEAGRNAWEQREDLPRPTWSYWISAATLAGDAGRAWLDLNHHDRAECELRRAVRLIGEGQRRDQSLHLVSLAGIQLSKGDVEGAAEAGRQAAHLMKETPSLRTQCRLKQLACGLDRYGGSAARTANDLIGVMEVLAPG